MKSPRLLPLWSYRKSGTCCLPTEASTGINGSPGFSCIHAGGRHQRIELWRTNCGSRRRDEGTRVDFGKDNGEIWQLIHCSGKSAMAELTRARGELGELLWDGEGEACLSLWLGQGRGRYEGCHAQRREIGCDWSSVTIKNLNVLLIEPISIELVSK